MPKNLEHRIYQKKGHVAYDTINRPEVRSALHSYAYAEPRSCWRDIGLDPDIQCGIIAATRRILTNPDHPRIERLAKLRQTQADHSQHNDQQRLASPR